MGLGGDFERLLGMLKRARVPITLDAVDFLWIKVPGSVFHFTDTGRHLTDVVRSKPNGGRNA